MLTFEIPVVKCHHGVEVNWSRYRDTGVTDPALIIILGKSAITHSKVGQSSPNPKNFEERKNSLGQVIYQKCITIVVSEKTA